MGIVCSFSKEIEKHLFRHVIGTTTRHQHAAGIEQFQSAQIDFFVTAGGRLNAGAVFRERRWVQHDRIKPFPSLFQFPQGVEDIRLAKLNVRYLVQFGVSLRNRNGAGGDVYTGNGFAHASKVKGEPTVESKTVERASVRELACSKTILTLIEKRACLLTGEWCHQKTDALLKDLQLIWSRAVEQTRCELQAF